MEEKRERIIEAERLFSLVGKVIGQAAGLMLVVMLLSVEKIPPEMSASQVDGSSQCRGACMDVSEKVVEAKVPVQPSRESVAESQRRVDNIGDNHTSSVQRTLDGLTAVQRS